MNFLYNFRPTLHHFLDQKHHFNMNLNYILLLILGSIILSCNSEPEKCRYGNAEPIFAPSYEKVVNHSFSKKGQLTFEQIVFENKMELEIHQSGCDSVRQVFQFKIPEDVRTEKPAYFKEMTIQVFGYLSLVSDKHFSLHHLGKVVSQHFNEIKLGKSFRMQENYFLKIDRILGLNETILVVELSSSSH